MEGLNQKSQNLSTRMKDLVAEFTDGNVLKFAKLINTSDTNIRNYIAGRQPSTEILSSIAQTFNINLHWLITGIGNKLLNDSNIVYAPEKTSHEYRKIEMVELLNEIRQEDDKIKREALVNRISVLIGKLEDEKIEMLNEALRIMKKMANL